MSKFFQCPFTSACFALLISSAVVLKAADTPPTTPPSSRIVGGTLVPASDFPSVGIVFDSTGMFTCTGTLLDATHVLTAGHCATDMDTGKPLPDANGRFALNGNVYETTHIFVHPTFNLNLLGTDGIFDAAIFELALPVTGVTPSPINRQPVTVGTPVTLVGYGLTGSGKNAKLKRTPPPGMISKGTNTVQSVTVSQLTWMYQPPSDASNAPGDSGGPAFIDQGNGALAIAGITSEGETNGNTISSGAQNFDTRIDTIAPWIDFILTGSSSNQPPVIVSPVSSDQNPVAAGAVVQFSVVASDPDDPTLFYVWDFGDGSGDTGQTPPHIFSIPGTYTVTATATDGIGAATSTETVIVTPLATGGLSIDRMVLGVNFAKAGQDSLSLQANIQPPAGALRLPATGVLRVGSVTLPLMLAAKGQEKSDVGTFKLDLNSGKFTASARHGQFSQSWAKDGLIDADVTSIPITMEVDLVLNGILFSTTRQLSYAARQGKSGRAK
jgi:PKD repeat protein